MPADRSIDKMVVEAYTDAILHCAGGDTELIIKLYTELESLVTAYYMNSNLATAFANESIDEDLRRQMAQGTFETFSDGLREVLVTMAIQGDIDLIRRIADAYIARAEESLGAVIVEVVTAVELDDHLREIIKAKLSSDFGCDALLVEKVDSSIIGGIIMSARGRSIDASMATMLEESRVALCKPPTGGEI